MYSSNGFSSNPVERERIMERGSYYSASSSDVDFFCVSPFKVNGCALHLKEAM